MRLCGSKFLVQEENPRQARLNEQEPTPVQPEVSRYRRRSAANKEMNQIRGLGSKLKVDKKPQTKTRPPQPPSAVVLADGPKLPEKPPQPELNGEQRRDDISNETNQSRKQSSILEVDNQPQTETRPPKSLSAAVFDSPKLPEKLAKMAYYCNVCLINTTRFGLDVSSFVTYQVSFTNLSDL